MKTTNEAINRAVDWLNQKLVAADALAQALDAAGGENPPPWVFVFQDQIEGIRQASEALEMLLSGYGGHAPHGDHTEPGDPLFRGSGLTPQGSAARPEQPSSLAYE